MSTNGKIRILSVAMIIGSLISLTACKKQPISAASQASMSIIQTVKYKTSSTLSTYYANYDINDWVDPDTGVHYIIFSDKGKYAGAGGITPRLNSDGSIMVDEK